MTSGRSSRASPRIRARTKTSARTAPQRAKWGSISRAQVVDAATRVIEAGGFEEMTIRSLAADIGVAPMSLYRYVRDKDDLLEEVVDRLLARAWRPRVSVGDWRAWIAEAADKFRHFLVSQPAALHVFLHHPVVSPAALDRMEEMLRLLRQAGFSQTDAQNAYAVIHTYTLGFAAVEASRAGWTPPDHDGDSLTARLATFTTPRQFRVGLDYLLEAVEQRAQSNPASKRRGMNKSRGMHK